jgi:hypothetical protein
MPLHSVRGCSHAQCEDALALSTRIPPHHTRLFFNPTAKMRSSLLQGCPGPHCDTFIALPVIYHSSPCWDIKVALPPGCSRHLLPLNPAYYSDFAPPLSRRCPCIQCVDALITLERMRSPTPWLCAAPYCGFVPLSTATMCLQSMLGCPYCSREDVLAPTVTFKSPPIARMPWRSMQGSHHTQCKDPFTPNARIPSRPIQESLHTQCEDALTLNARIPSHPMLGISRAQCEDALALNRGSLALNAKMLSPPMQWSLRAQCEDATR